MGDRVFLKLRPFRQKSLAWRVNEKVAVRFYKPYEIETRVGPVAYRLKLPVESKIHNTFHVSQIRKLVGEAVTMSPYLHISDRHHLNLYQDVSLFENANKTSTQ